MVKEQDLREKHLHNLIKFKRNGYKQTVPKKENFDEAAQKEFLNGAKIAYETIITDFSDNDNKITTSKPLLK